MDTGPSEIVRRLTTPPPAYIQPLDITPPPTRFALACRGYIEGTAPNSCPRQPSGPSGIGITGGVSSPDAPPPREEGLDDTILDDDLEETLLCYMEQDAEAQRDALAQAIANQIRRLNNTSTNPDNAEFGAFILRLADGSIARVPLRRGETGQISLRNLLNAAQAAFPGASASNVIGIVHSHPSETGPGFVDTTTINDLSPLDYGNTMPSHPNISAGPNDWENARNFLQANGNSNIDGVSHYILGPDGVLREFDYSDGHPAESVEQAQLIEDAEADARGECS